MQTAIEGAKSENEHPPEGVMPVLRHAIRFESVGFRYRDAWVLRNVTLTIPAGGITAIVGPSGAGKTTVIDLVTALLRPQDAGTRDSFLLRCAGEPFRIDDVSRAALPSVLF